MKNTITLIFFLIHFGHIRAQNGFYIKPAINYLKFYKNNDIGYNFNSKSGSQLKISADNFYQNYPDISLGLNFGYKSKNFFYECGYYADETSNSIKFDYLYYNQNINTNGNTINYYSGHEYSISGVSQRSFPFRVGVKLFQKKSSIYEKISTSLYVIAGFEIQSNYGTLSPQIRESGYTPDGINNIKITITTERSIIKRNTKPTIGLLFEVKNNNDCNLFNLTMNYNLNLKQTNWLQTRTVVVEDIDGKKYYVGSFSSTGSGLYLGISKNIYFNKIFKKKKTINNN